MKYAQTFLKKYALKNNEIITSFTKLYNLFFEEFGEIILNENTLTSEEKDKLIFRYKKTNNIQNEDNINIKTVLNIKNLINGAYTFLRNYRENNKELYNNMNNFSINNKKVVSVLKVNFKRKNKIFNKDIFVIMTDQMEENIVKKENIQYFFDVTYYATPPGIYKFKLLVILAFNRELFKSIIINLSLIQNENKETFVTILSYLKNKYNWHPNNVTIDYSKAEKKALTEVFPNIQFIPCFYHYMVNITKHIPELKSKNKSLKLIAKDCLANIKLLSFVPLSKFNNFYNLIVDKYRVKIPKFFKYFEKNYIRGKIFDKTIWNYTKAINNNINNDIIFYTNNIVESFNSIINKKLIGLCRTMYNYKRALVEVISLYEMKDKYIERKISITRALEHYIKIKDNFDLINHEIIKEIKKEYVKYLEGNNLPLGDINNSNNDSDTNSDYYVKRKEEDIYESEEESLSSNSENDFVNNNNINNNDSEDDDDDNHSNNNANNNNDSISHIPKKKDKGKDNINPFSFPLE